MSCSPDASEGVRNGDESGGAGVAAGALPWPHPERAAAAREAGVPALPGCTQEEDAGKPRRHAEGGKT